MIAVMGEALVDIVEDRSGYREHPGGGPMNIAVGLARLGCDVELFSDVGGDRLGEVVRRYLVEEGVRLNSPDSSSTSSARARIGADGSARYQFDVRWNPGVPKFGSWPDLLHVGSLGAFLSPGDGAVRVVVRDARASTLISFDPNIRPQLVPPPEICRVVCEDLIAAADVVKLSEEDAEYIWSGLSVDEVLNRTLALGASLAVVTRGAEGAVLASRSVRLSVDAPSVAVRDTIGAGDSFMAGLLFALLRASSAALSPEAFSEALTDPETIAAVGRFAVACAAVTVTRAGANPPRLDEIDGALTDAMDKRVRRGRSQ